MHLIGCIDCCSCESKKKKESKLPLMKKAIAELEKSIEGSIQAALKLERFTATRFSAGADTLAECAWTPSTATARPRTMLPINLFIVASSLESPVTPV